MIDTPTGVRTFPGLTFSQVDATKKVSPEAGLGGDKELDFLGFLGDAVKISGPILGTVLQTGPPLVLGPLGAPVGAAAGVPLSAAAKLAESATAKSGFEQFAKLNGVAERALLGEAALQAVLSLDPEKNRTGARNMTLKSKSSFGDMLANKGNEKENVFKT